MKIFIKPDTDYYYPVLYVLKLIENNQSVRFDFVESAKDATICWDHSAENSQPICLPFFDALKNHSYDFFRPENFTKAPVFFDDNGRKDVVATIFYMVNCLQEINPKEKDLDQFGRFKYEATYQSRFNNIEENLVQHEIDSFVIANQIKGNKKESAFFVSHDVDSLYGSLMQDGLWALKNMRIGVLLSLITHELIKKPHWKNMDKIIKMNNDYDVRSTFFWLVNQGKGTANIGNADYNINREQALLKLVNQAGFFNGLHKSCSIMEIDEELEKENLISQYNRYHFLNFLPHCDWKKISDSALKLDCSLGFAERYGFRNSYGKSFQPFDLEKNEPFRFVETPLTFMDTTLYRYMKIQSDKMADLIIGFYEKNKYNCHHSLLWHNNSLTDYKYGFLLKEYKKIMSYLYENNVKTVTPEMIIEECSLEW